MAEKLVPNLRFAGFNDEWVSQKFKDNLDIKSGKGFKASEYSKIGIPLLKIDNVSYGKVSWETKDYLPQDYLDKYPDLVLKANDIVLALNRPITNNKLKIAKLTKEDEISILYQRVGKIFVNEDLINKEFIFQLLNKEIFRFVLKNSVGSDQPFISTNQLKELEFNVPQFEEQEKIGKFLFFINAKIELLEKQYHAYKNFKKYLMQQIFTQKLRFNNYDEDWKETKIGNIAEVVGGGTPKTEIDNYWNGDIKWYTPSEIGKTKYINDSERHITEEGLKNSSAKLLPKNTILLSSRATVGEVSITLTECSTNQGFQSLITKNNVDNEFIYYLISTIKNEFLKRSSGSTFLEISKNEIKKIKINVPSLNEQKQIGNVLSDIDKKIFYLEDGINKTQEFKKGLLQQMFI